MQHPKISVVWKENVLVVMIHSITLMKMSFWTHSFFICFLFVSLQGLQCVCKEKLFCSTNIWKGTKLSVSKDWVECHKCTTSSYWMMSFLLSTFKLRLMLQRLLGHKNRFFSFPILHYKVGIFLTGNCFQRTQLRSIRWVDSRSVVETWASLPPGFWEFWMARVP